VVFVSVDLVLVTWWWWFKHAAATLLVKKIITPVFLGQNNNFYDGFDALSCLSFPLQCPTKKKTSKKNSFLSIRPKLKIESQRVYRARAKVLEFKSKNKPKEKEAQSVR